MQKTTIKIAISLFILCASIFAQEQVISDSTLVPDTVSDSGYVMTKSPWTAVLMSAVVPGLGQIYNESYWKAPFIWGLAYYLLDIWISNNNSYWDYAKRYAVNPTPINKTNREFYHNQRDQFAVYMGLTYVLNLVDAYVDAQLFDFSVTPDPVSFNPRINLTVKF